ncbi:dihydrodipicolinate synthase family protein [Agromyces neolithicus]|uniref:Dihydrodipicolinate synthase family protein n=1 Tax=Agromyces neolithicus TaxID=269420 RepID=A0ABN2M8X9_9MICO
MFAGLSAFPLTPLRNDEVDEVAYAGLIERLVAAGVDSITALGSTGAYPYLTTDERRRVARVALEHAGSVPVVVGVGALRTSQVIGLARDAADAGASGVLLAPMSYQPLTDDDVFGLYEDVAAAVPLPVIVYDNPGTTHFEFSDALYARIAQLPNIASIKIPGVPAEPDAARARVEQIRSAVSDRVTIGISGDASAARGLNAGCDTWYSVIGGTLPEAALAICRAARSGDAAAAMAESDRLQPLWDLFAEHGGSFRVIAAIAELGGLVTPNSLPLPVRGLDRTARDRVARVVRELGLIPPA